MRSTVNEGDLIRSNGESGNVLKVGLRAIKILNATGQHVEIPNRLFMDNPFTEYSATGFRRLDVKGQMNIKENLGELKEKIEEEMSKFDFVYSEKKPNMVYNEIKKEKVDYTLRVWMNFTNNDGEFLNARSQCIVRLSELLKEQNVEFPVEEVKILREG